MASVVDINCFLTESNPVLRKQDENSLTLRGRLMSAQLEISDKLVFRNYAIPSTWLDSVVIGRLDMESQDHAIPHYEIRLSVHENTSKGCHGVGRVDDLIFWLDAQFVVEHATDGDGDVVTSAARSVLRVHNPDPSSVEIWCLFLYKTERGFGALVLRKSRRHERLGLMEIYGSHSGFGKLVKTKLEDVRIV